MPYIYIDSVMVSIRPISVVVRDSITSLVLGPSSQLIFLRSLSRSDLEYKVPGWHLR